jgi:hypothetical protein
VHALKIKSLEEIDSVRMYLSRIGAEMRSLRTAVIKEMRGNYWKDVALIQFNRDGTIACAEAHLPTESELAQIKVDLARVEWPFVKPIKKLVEKGLPEELAGAAKEDIFEFRNAQGLIVCVQLRKKLRDGAKAYVPFTFWDDDTWRKMEPEGPLPIFNIEKVKAGGTVFIHEGAKAARAVQELIEGNSPEARAALLAHPWGEELKSATHLGWIGGALSPHRTDWSALKSLGIRRAYIVSDNDSPGLSAVPAIAFNLRVPTFHVQFTNEWPVSFDLADDFPPDMFREIDGARYYIGPSFRSCLHPATWATDLIPNPKGKPTTVLRDHFKELWHYVEEADLFVCTEMPEILRQEAILNKMLSSFSHSQETSKLIVKAFTGRNTKLCYRPDIDGRIVTDKTTSAVNLHTPANIRAKRGSPSLWLKFMDYLVPDEGERHELMRWVATLIAQPGVKMEYACLLVSESQGIGKTTLASKILAPLVGVQNTSWPTESEIVGSEFNTWLANKRLVIVNEIYSGHSWKAYNKLKSIITDRDVTVNQKYQRPYTIENWCHIFACSNSLKALRIEEDDRRWFYPSLSESGWPKEKFTELNNWLSSGGLQIIMDWAECFKGGYVNAGERAPMTIRKRAVIEDSRSEAQRECLELAAACNSPDIGEAAMAMKEVFAWAKNAVDGRVYDSEYDLRKALRDGGMKIFGQRIKIAGRMQYIVLNDKAHAKICEIDAGDAAEYIRQILKSPSAFLGEAI